MAADTRDDVDNPSIESDDDSDSDKKGFVNASQIRPEEINKIEKAVSPSFDS
jgi:hypothetical protein